MSEANNITFAQAKTSFFYRPKVKRKYNTLHLAGKEGCKKDEVCATSHKEDAQFYSPMASSIASQWYSAYAEWYSLREFYGE